MEKAFENLKSLTPEELKADQLQRQKKDVWYVIPDYEQPTRGFHSHYCRLCCEEQECGKDECYWTYEYVCHKCYDRPKI